MFQALNIDLSALDRSWRIEEITWAALPYKRPRKAGCNARLGVHGWGGEVPVARITMGGVSGFGWCTLSKEQAGRLTGLSVAALFGEGGLLRREYHGLEFPLLDWLGQVSGKPVYRLVAGEGKLPGPGAFSVPVYDTTIYFDELEIADGKEAVAFICREVEEGLARGHRHFKVKIGRCGMWMDLDGGLRRDIDIILAIRERIGPAGKLMADANNGYNLNITKTFLQETASARLHWLEEAFHEDDRLYANLKDWMAGKAMETLIADGEGYASSALLDWAKKGLIDVVQYDLRDYGFFRWMELGAQLAPHGVLAAPHNYGGFYGNYAQGHFAAAVDNFAFAEWDQADAEGVDTSAYVIRDGEILIPEKPGFGLELDGQVFDRIAGGNGWRVALRG